MQEKKSWSQMFSPTKGEFGQPPPAPPTIDEVDRGRVGQERYGAAQPVHVPATGHRQKPHHKNRGNHKNGGHGGRHHHRGKGR